jgi:hypothetical protein
LTTKNQRAVYAAEETLSRFPPSQTARELLGYPRSHHQCAEYLHHVMGLAWFSAAFPNARLLWVAGGQGHSYCSESRHGIKISTDHRVSTATAERTCLHELAHLVTGKECDDKSHGHHRAWRVHYAFLVKQMLGYRAERYLKKAFLDAGLAT